VQFTCEKRGEGEGSHPKRHRVEQKFRDLGCNIFRIEKSANPYRSARSLRLLLQKEQYDIVHSHFGYTSGGFALGAHAVGLPFLNSFHAAAPTALERWDHYLGLRQIKKGWLRVHRYLLDRYVTKHMGHSKTNLDSFEPEWSSFAERYTHLPNGINFPSCLNKIELPYSRPLFLHVGSFRPAKNHSYLFSIFHEIRKRSPTASLLCIGEGQERARIEKTAGEGVYFVGAKDNLWPYYAAADLFLFPSSSEGFANVLVEAQAAALPVAASLLPAHRESLAPMQHHALFPLGDPATAASIALAHLKQQQGVAESQHYVKKHFSIESFAERLAELYRSLGCGHI